MLRRDRGPVTSVRMGRDQRRRRAPWLSRRPVPALLAVVSLVYCRLLWAGFVRFDDDLHVYANPYLNPATWQSVARLWQHAYEHLYVPLAYTIFAAIGWLATVPAQSDASLGQSISLAAMAFHLASLLLHLANTWLCFTLVRRLAGRTRPAWLCALLFALHPLQLESVGWISELRGVTSAAFLLSALNVLVLSRRVPTPRRARQLLALSVPLVVCAMLCKPSAAVAPLVALAIDRIALQTPWRKALVVASIWAGAVLPFAWLTRASQAVAEAGAAPLWQRPFVAGDALAFYLFKTVAPFALAIDYGRTPHQVMSHAWGYLAWTLPVALLALGYLNRRRHPLGWLGALSFVIFLLPTSGLVPFAYQSYSTVADRYVYLALIGAGLVVSTAADRVKSPKTVVAGAVVLFTALGALSFAQSRYWLTTADLLRHTIALNPAAGFAYNNLGDMELGNGDLQAALADYRACVEHDPTRVKAYLNLADVYTTLNQPADAERALAQVARTSEMTGDDLSNLGIVLMKMNQPARALEALAAATATDPRSPTYLFNQGNALAAVGQFDQAEATFRHCLALAPTLAGAHTGLGIVLAETGRLEDAITEFRSALRLQPNDAAALDDLKRAEGMTQQQ